MSDIAITAALVRAGVSLDDQMRTMSAVNSDSRLTLAILTLHGEPRAGDVIRKPDAAPLQVELAVPGFPGRWAVVGIGLPDRAETKGDIFAKPRVLRSGP